MEHNLADIYVAMIYIKMFHMLHINKPHYPLVKLTQFDPGGSTSSKPEKWQALYDFTQRVTIKQILDA